MPNRTQFDHESEFAEALNQEKGKLKRAVILVCGYTGSGKTRTRWTPSFVHGSLSIITIPLTAPARRFGRPAIRTLRYSGDRCREQDMNKYKRDITRMFAAVALIGCAFSVVSGETMVQAQDRNSALIDASKKGDLQEVNRLLTEGADVNAKGSNGVTALMAASELGQVEVVKTLLDKGADTKAKDLKGQTALIWASGKGLSDAVEVSFAKGAFSAKDVNNMRAWTRTSESGRVEVLWTSQGQFEVVKVLLEKEADVNAKAKDGKTALMWASKNGHVEVVKLLKAHGAK
jgi:hypothetical protein